MLQTVDDAGDTLGKRSFRVRYAVAHGVAGADLHGNAGLLGQGLKLVDKRNHKAIEVGPGDVFQVATGNNTGIEGILHSGQVILHSLPAGHLHFLEDVVVGAAD